MTAYDYNALKTEIRIDGGLTYDPWGTAMQWWFGIAESLHFTHERDTPDHWHFRPSPIQTETDADDWCATFCDGADPDDLERFGNVLERYTRLLKRAGLDY